LETIQPIIVQALIFHKLLRFAYRQVTATKRGTTQDFNNHLFILLFSSLHEKMQMHDPSLYNY